MRSYSASNAEIGIIKQMMWVMVILFMDMFLLVHIKNKFFHLDMDMCYESSNIENSYGVIELKELVLKLLETYYHIVKLLQEFMLWFLKRIMELFKRDNVKPQ